MTTIALQYRSMQHRLKAISLPVINWKFIYFFGIIALFSMLMFYTYSINKLTGGSYVIKNYNKQISALQQENNNVEAHFAASGLMGNVLKKASQLSFEKTTQVKYIEILGNSLAKAASK